MPRTVFAIVAFLLATSAAPLSAFNFLVTTTADSGAGSLRQAIFDANGNGGADTISFVFPGTSPVTIGILTALPEVTDTLTIDGTTMPGVAMAGRPLVEVRGMVAGGTQGGFYGIDLQAQNCVVRGLIITHFYVGLNLGRPGGHTIQGNWIGLAASGTSAAGNNRGVQTEAASNNNLIGGTTASQRNVISGNLTEGITISGLCQISYCLELSSNDRIQGNFIGTDASGNAAVPNIGAGIWLTSRAANTIIGGPQAGGPTRNIISGNGGDGINVDGPAIITYNWIGRNAAGAALGNTYAGIRVDDTVGSTIGFNSIAHNANEGVLLVGLHTFVYANSIFSNGRLGISMFGLVPRPNDAGDPDTGPNDGQNYPVITSARAESTQLFLTGALNSAANSNYYVTFYSNTTCDPSGYGEGETLIGAASVNTNGLGNGTFNITIPASGMAGRYITAIARDASLNSSEFSQCQRVLELGPPRVTSINPTSGQWGTNVILTGDHLINVTSVAFSSGAVPTPFVIFSDTQITAYVPTGATTGPIRLVNPYGSTLTDPFTVTNASPEVLSIQPTGGLGGGGTSVTIRGSFFQSGASVRIGGVPATNVVVSDQYALTATTGPHPAGTVDVEVINVDGGIGRLEYGYTYFCSPALFTTITAPERLHSGATGNIASVPDAGPGATYAWQITGGTITGGGGTRSITFNVGIQDATLDVTITRPDCSASSSLFIGVRVVSDDFNGDGKADIPMQNQSNGDVAVWMMNGMNMFNGVLIGNSGGYRLKTVGDFDGDGKNDFAFQHPATGDIVMWLMNGASISTAPPVTNPGSNWRLVGSGDLNGDRKDDLVLQDANSGDVAGWLMNGSSILDGNVIGTPGTSYTVGGVADRDHDGRAHIFLQSNSGDIADWWLNGLSLIGGGSLGNPGTRWGLKGVADVTGDGDNLEILLRDSVAGDVAAWQMDGLFVSGFNIGNPGTSYDLMGAADYNGDWNADALLRTNSGTLVVWLLNRATVTNGLAIGSTGADYVPVLK